MLPPRRLNRRATGPATAAARLTPAEQAVEQARAYLDAHLDEQVPLQVLADEVGLNPYHLQRTFKRFVGLSPKQYQDVRRLEAFKEHVGEDRNVLEATFEAGFGSSRALYDQAEARLGMTPGTYRRGGEGLAIRFTTLASVLGQVLVAVTERGVCAVSLGEEDTILVAELKDEFPNAAAIERDDEAMQAWAVAGCRRRRCRICLWALPCVCGAVRPNIGMQPTALRAGFAVLYRTGGTPDTVKLSWSDDGAGPR